MHAYKCNQLYVCINELHVTVETCSHVFLQATGKLNNKLSQSSAAIVDQKPVTAEDLDNVLEGLAKFNVESSM